MSQWIKFGTVKDFTNKRYKTIKFLAKWIAVVRSDNGSFFATEAGCKHQNINLFSKGWTGGTLVCPAHKWEYNIESGQCLNQQWACLRRYPIKIENDEIFVFPKIEETEDEEDWY